MGSCSFLCVLMISNVSIWVFRGPYEFQWVLMGPYFSLFVFRGNYGSLLVFMRPYKSVKVFLVSLRPYGV